MLKDRKIKILHSRMLTRLFYTWANSKRFKHTETPNHVGNVNEVRKSQHFTHKSHKSVPQIDTSVTSRIRQNIFMNTFRFLSVASDTIEIAGTQLDALQISSRSRKVLLENLRTSLGTM